MTEKNEDVFSGWPSGEGQSIALIRASLKTMSNITGLEIFHDGDVIAVWIKSPQLGPIVVYEEPSISKNCVEIVVDKRSDFCLAKKIVSDHFISKLSKNIDYEWYIE